MIIPDTNARGWLLWVLVNAKKKEVLRHEYKTSEEAKEDNQRLAKGTLGWKWILNNGTDPK